ncbi:MAG TPA: cytochrome c peroxidase [Polyangiales bacterium]|nr:cytochrome c peroxidase [Polyangiales bacterium]
MTSALTHAARFLTTSTLLLQIAAHGHAQASPPNAGPAPTPAPAPAPTPTKPGQQTAPAQPQTSPVQQQVPPLKNAQQSAPTSAAPQTSPSNAPPQTAPETAAPRAAPGSTPSQVVPSSAAPQAAGNNPPQPQSANPVSGGGTAPHGATPMDQQLKQIATLVPETVKNAPAGISAEYWKALVPADNPLNEARVALGRKLYFETRLSKDGTVACATCHDVTRGFTDRRNTSEGINDQIGQRNAPTTLNAAFFSSQFWDGRAGMLEDQALLPIVNPIEMGQPNGAAVVASIASDAEYQKEFQAAYGRAINYEDIGRALAAFERTLIFLDAPFDRFARGDANAISRDAQAGWALFNGKARCTSCHQISSSNPVGTDSRFHNIGVSARHQDFELLAKKGLAALKQDASKEAIDKLALQTNLSELGRFVVTRNRSDIGAFKTSQLRNVGVTAPYMHDGSMATLWDIMDHYNKGGEVNPYLDGGIEPLALSETELAQVVAFLFTLTDLRLDDQNKSEMERQRAIAKQRRPFRDDNAANRKVLQFEQRATAQR